MTRFRQQPKISHRLFRLCTSGESVSFLLANDPRLAPGEAWERLYGETALEADWNAMVELTAQPSRARRRRFGTDDSDGSRCPTPKPPPPDELEKAARCGKWGPTRPSDLFLRIFHDSLCTLEDDPLRAVVSPSLMGSCGTVPLTVISVMPDIVRHMSNVIVRAEREVFLATNYWQNSTASKYITNAIRELDRRAGARGTRVVLKILYDRGSPRQLVEPHYLVGEKEFTSKNVNLPHPSELPNTDMQVMNFHKPLMGTLHAKFMVVDRKIALLQSNNIQDNDNLEMLIHLEGPIVDSFYDMALISWHKKLDPPLPSYNSPAGDAWPLSSKDESNGLGKEKDHDSRMAETVQSPPKQTHLPAHTADDPHYDDDIAGEVARIQCSLSPKPGETQMEPVTRLLNHTVNEGFPGDPNAPRGEPLTPYIPHQAHTPYPMALVNRHPYGTPRHRSLETPQNIAWLSALRNAKQSVLIVSPTLNAGPIIEAILEACERGVDVTCYICLSYNDAGELLPRQGGHNEGVSWLLHRDLSEAGVARLHFKWYVAKDQTAPLAQSRRLRSSHVKLMVVDGRVAIHGNGNQDTQSWFHSQEANLLVDSEDLCAAWVRALEANQNTAAFGGVRREDGVWRDAEGKEALAALGVDPGRFSWLKGMMGAVQRVRGTGGF